MSPALGVAVMLNNYFHDVATAMLVTSGVALWIMVKNYQGEEGAPAARYFLATYASMKRLLFFSLAWIIVGGFPRLYFYEEFEWANAAGKAQIPALIVKHIIALVLLGAGAMLWVKLRKRANEARTSLGS